MIVFGANTPNKCRDFWRKSLRISDDYLSSVVPDEKSYDLSNKQQKKIIMALKNKFQRQKTRIKTPSGFHRLKTS